MVSNILRLVVLLFVGLSAANAQILNPAKWTTESSVTDAKTGDEITLIFHATIDNNWYLYSSEFPCEDGPIKTTFTFLPNKNYVLVGGIVPVNPLEKHDKIFECDVKIFKGTAAFRQKIKVLAAPLNISGSYEYQVCTELTGQCVPGEGEFLFDKIKVSGSKLQVTNPQSPDPKSQGSISKPQVSNSDSSSLQQPATGNLPSAIIMGPQLDPALVRDDGK